MIGIGTKSRPPERLAEAKQQSLDLAEVWVSELPESSKTAAAARR